MGKFGVGLTGVIIFGGIGALFGGVGMLIGIILGIIVGFSHDPEEAKKKEAAEKEEKQKERQVIASSTTSYHQTKNDGIYVEVVTELMAACITADATIEESEIDLATSFIESDEVILDKKAALEKLKANIDDFYKEREKSKALFKLKMTSVIHKAKEIVSSLQKERVLIILDGMLDSIKEGNRKEAEDFVEKIRQILAVNQTLDSKQSAAEQYILNSGDAEAISSLKKMQKNPSTYKENFKQASKGNSVMRTALGVFTGMIAANLVTNAFHQYQLKEALANFDTELESMGGIDNLQLDQGGNIQTANLDYSESLESSENLGIEDTEELVVASNEDSFDDIETDDIDVDSDTDLEDFDFFS